MTDKVLPALQAGAWGYLTKDSEPSEIVQAVRDVHQGMSPMRLSVDRSLFQQLTGHGAAPKQIDLLTSREKEVLRLLARGYQDIEIAEELHIEPVTVRTHVNHVLGKLQATNRIQAALRAIKEGLTDV
jgi:DNA-binding NarL/FixJ family response regulator